VLPIWQLIEHEMRSTVVAGPMVAQRLARSSGEINDAASSGRVGFTDDASQLVQAELDVIIECTGNAESGVQHSLWAIEARRHVVMVTVEADALVGPLLREQADRAGVVYSMAYGDQPALISEMVDWARTCGFDNHSLGRGSASDSEPR
jgi:predicted homoserine dehydrogenase-like protein